MGCAACPTLYAQHCTKVLTLMMGPYTASALPPRYRMICRLNSTVRMPIATSMKKEEKPDTVISHSLRGRRSTRTRRRVFRRRRKWDSSTSSDTTEPMAVARPAP